MARKRLISSEDLLDLLEQYLISHCSRDPNLVKISKFGDFVRKNGFPEVTDTTIRRNKQFRNKLEEYQSDYEDESYQTVISYKTLDVENFILRNRNPIALRAALTELSQYYKKIADLAISYKQQADSLREEYNALKTECEELKTTLSEDNVLQEENQKLRGIINTSVYPEIANQLLRADGLLKSDDSIISQEYLKYSTITSETIIDFSDEKITANDSKHTKKAVSIKSLLDSKTNY
ncbi:TPA: hypothetical protein U1W74_001950 [Streptococcus suis]|nr:hypothetical protein [Streptococcus suis]HEM4177518.1 hypothetical protein [Streptococcus suis]